MTDENRPDDIPVMKSSDFPVESNPPTDPPTYIPLTLRQKDVSTYTGKDIPLSMWSAYDRPKRLHFESDNIILYNELIRLRKLIDDNSKADADARKYISDNITNIIANIQRELDKVKADETNLDKSVDNINQSLGNIADFNERFNNLDNTLDGYKEEYKRINSILDAYKKDINVYNVRYDNNTGDLLIDRPVYDGDTVTINTEKVADFRKLKTALDRDSAIQVMKDLVKTVFGKNVAKDTDPKVWSKDDLDTEIGDKVDNKYNVKPDGDNDTTPRFTSNKEIKDTINKAVLNSKPNPAGDTVAGVISKNDIRNLADNVISIQNIESKINGDKEHFLTNTGLDNDIKKIFDPIQNYIFNYYVLTEDNKKSLDDDFPNDVDDNNITRLIKHIKDVYDRHPVRWSSRLDKNYKWSPLYSTVVDTIKQSSAGDYSKLEELVKSNSNYLPYLLLINYNLDFSSSPAFGDLIESAPVAWSTDQLERLLKSHRMQSAVLSNWLALTLEDFNDYKNSTSFNGGCLVNPYNLNSIINQVINDKNTEQGGVVTPSSVDTAIRNALPSQVDSSNTQSTVAGTISPKQVADIAKASVHEPPDATDETPGVISKNDIKSIASESVHSINLTTAYSDPDNTTQDRSLNLTYHDPKDDTIKTTALPVANEHDYGLVTANLVKKLASETFDDKMRVAKNPDIFGNGIYHSTSEDGVLNYTVTTPDATDNVKGKVSLDDIRKIIGEFFKDPNNTYIKSISSDHNNSIEYTMNNGTTNIVNNIVGDLSNINLSNYSTKDDLQREFDARYAPIGTDPIVRRSQLTTYATQSYVNDTVTNKGSELNNSISAVKGVVEKEINDRLPDVNTIKEQGTQLSSLNEKLNTMSDTVSSNNAKLNNLIKENKGNISSLKTTVSGLHDSIKSDIDNEYNAIPGKVENNTNEINTLKQSIDVTSNPIVSIDKTEDSNNITIKFTHKDKSVDTITIPKSSNITPNNNKNYEVASLDEIFGNRDGSKEQ